MVTVKFKESGQANNEKSKPKNRNERQKRKKRKKRRKIYFIKSKGRTKIRGDTYGGKRGEFHSRFKKKKSAKSPSH